MKPRLTIAALLLSSLLAGAQDKPRDLEPGLPPGPNPNPPETSEENGKLHGDWILDNTSMAKAMTDSMSKSTSGTKFVLDEINGDYMASIDLEKKEVAVNWLKWEFKGTAHTERSGTFPVVVRISGRQDYTITAIEDGETAKSRTIAVKLKRNAAIASVFFRGMLIPNAKVDIPSWKNGQWTVNVDTFFLKSDGQTWKFMRDRSKATPKPLPDE